MTTSFSQVFSLSVQAGDKAADRAVAPHYEALRRKLARHCLTHYSPVIKEFSPVLHIDGAVWRWDLWGHSNTRVQKNSGHATVDIFMPSGIWQAGSAQDIRLYMARHLRGGIESLARKISSLGIHLDRMRLLGDLDLALEDFLKPA